MLSVNMSNEKFNTVCRLCLKQETSMSSIFNKSLPQDDSSELAEKITSIAPIQISSDDGLPASICQQCKDLVDKFYDFRLLVEASDRTLRHSLTSEEVKYRVEAKQEENVINNNHLTLNAVLVPIQSNVKVFKICALNKNLRILKEESPEENDTKCFDVLVENRCDTKERSTIKSEECDTSESTENEKEDTECLPSDNETICQLCLRSFQCVSDLKSHISEHFSITKESRRIIEDQNASTSKNETVSDLVKVLRKRKSNLREDKCVPDRLICGLCHIVMSTREEYNVHLKKHALMKHYQCRYCGKMFIRSSCCKMHEQKHVQDKKFVCSICNDAFFKKSELRQHKSSHESERPICSICNKQFQTAYSYKRHMGRHMPGSKCICKICGKNYHTNSELARHLHTHYGRRDYACHVCEMSFFSKPELNRHVKYHTGERRFKCNICFKAYFEAGHLRIHERVHTGERPFVCTYCGKGFTSQSKVKRHKKIHQTSDVH